MLAPLALALACAQGETPPADSAAMAPMAPAGLTEADVAGTWTGTAMPMDADTVLARWKQVCAAGSCTGTNEMNSDTVMSTYTVAGDSSVGMSNPYMDSMLKLRVVDSWVARVPSPGRVVGTLVTRMADRPDSVVMRTRFEGTRAP
jgi:hypothetical protein